jgi:hypothetical protein
MCLREFKFDGRFDYCICIKTWWFYISYLVQVLLLPCQLYELALSTHLLLVMMAHRAACGRATLERLYKCTLQE